MISDTHTRHNELELPGGDVLIHAGDFMSSGDDSLELLEFLNWLYEQPYKHKILIAGNHDRLFEDAPTYAIQLIDDVNHDGSIKYLQDNGCEIDGIKFWGTPWTPAFYEWAFQLYGDDGKAIFDLIPNDTDVLISHGPAYGLLDEITTPLMTGATPGHIGCKHLLKAIDRVNPKLHVCGHIHSSQGVMDGYGEVTTHINASCLGEDYTYSNDKEYFEWTIETLKL